MSKLDNIKDAIQRHFSGENPPETMVANDAVGMCWMHKNKKKNDLALITRDDIFWASQSCAETVKSQAK